MATVARVEDEAYGDTPMWLSHHWPDDYDRCIRIRGRHVCRRCAVLYPVSLIAAAVFGLVGSWPASLETWLLWLLPLPAVIEFVAEQLGIVRHSPTRLIALSIPLGIACGQLYVRYLSDLGDGLVWAVVGVYGGICLASLLLRTFRSSRS